MHGFRAHMPSRGRGQRQGARGWVRASSRPPTPHLCPQEWPAADTSVLAANPGGALRDRPVPGGQVWVPQRAGVPADLRRGHFNNDRE